MSREYKYRDQTLDGKPHNPEWNKEQVMLPYYQSAAIECRESYAFFLFILNILLPGLGTLTSSIADRKGFNSDAILIAFLQIVSTSAFFFGWLWSVNHGYCIWR